MVDYPVMLLAQPNVPIATAVIVCSRSAGSLSRSEGTCGTDEAEAVAGHAGGVVPAPSVSSAPAGPVPA